MANNATAEPSEKRTVRIAAAGAAGYHGFAVSWNIRHWTRVGSDVRRSGASVRRRRNCGWVRRVAVCECVRMVSGMPGVSACEHPCRAGCAAAVRRARANGLAYRG